MTEQIEQTSQPAWLTITTSKSTVIFSCQHGINRHGEFWEWETISGSGSGDINGLFFTAHHTTLDYKRFKVSGYLLPEFNWWLSDNHLT